MADDPSKRFSVLCVDGDAAALKQIESILAPEFDVSTALRPDAALTMIEARSFDVICCDGRVSEPNALEFLRAVAEKDPRAELVFFTSTKSLFLDRSAVSESICYLFKPYKPERLIETIRSLATTASSKA